MSSVDRVLLLEWRNKTPAARTRMPANASCRRRPEKSQQNRSVSGGWIPEPRSGRCLRVQKRDWLGFGIGQKKLVKHIRCKLITCHDSKKSACYLDCWRNCDRHNHNSARWKASRNRMVGFKCCGRQLGILKVFHLANCNNFARFWRALEKSVHSSVVKRRSYPDSRGIPRIQPASKNTRHILPPLHRNGECRRVHDLPWLIPKTYLLAKRRLSRLY